MKKIFSVLVALALVMSATAVPSGKTSDKPQSIKRIATLKVDFLNTTQKQAKAVKAMNANPVKVVKTAKASTVSLDFPALKYLDHVADYGWWQFYGQNEDGASVSFSNDAAVTQAAGTYDIAADMDANHTYVSLDGANKIYFLSGTIVLSFGTNGEALLNANAVGEDGNTYVITASQKLVLPSANVITMSYNNGMLNISTTNDDPYFLFIETLASYQQSRSDFSQASLNSEVDEYYGYLSYYGMTDDMLFSENQQIDVNEYYQLIGGELAEAIDLIALATPFDFDERNGNVSYLQFNYVPAPNEPTSGTIYYFAGAANGWSSNNDSWKFTEVEGILTLEVTDLYGDFKIVENGAWHPQHGAATAGEGVALNSTYNLVKCDDSQGEADAPANCTILIPTNQGEGDWRYKNAKLTLNAADPNHLIISLVAGTLYDHNLIPKTYQIVGTFNNWDPAGAPTFEDVNGVPTVTIENLSGTFKIIEDHAWTHLWGKNWNTDGGLALGDPYVLGAKGNAGDPANLALVNPFASYQNAVLTLTKNENEEFVLTLVSGTFELVENDWFVPGAWNGWKCNDAAKMSPVAGVDNTYELLLDEFSGEFKLVYGQWAVEFGSAKQSQDTWELNTPYQLSTPCDNMRNASGMVYQDVSIRITVDYINATAIMLIQVPTPACYNVTYHDKDNEILKSEYIFLTLPRAPIVPGFTFLYWEVVSGILDDGINLRAAYRYDGDATSAPSVVVNPANPAQKLIREGNVYILRDGKTYTATGVKVE